MKALIGKKIGMTQVFLEDGKSVVGTILDVSGNYITKHLKNGDTLTHIEIGKDKKKSASKDEVGNYKSLKFVPKVKNVIKVKGEVNGDIASELLADVFSVGDKVQVLGETKGKGFAGVVKRYHFAGGPRTHGQSDRERAPGSIGNRTIPGRVYKGKRMGGHMGTDTQTIKNLKVLMVDAKEGLIVLSGSIPGARHSYVLIKE